jgi:hypothetical protein
VFRGKAGRYDVVNLTGYAVEHIGQSGALQFRGSVCFLQHLENEFGNQITCSHALTSFSVVSIIIINLLTFIDLFGLTFLDLALL